MPKVWRVSSLQLYCNFLNYSEVFLFYIDAILFSFFTVICSDARYEPGKEKEEALEVLVWHSA